MSLGLIADDQGRRHHLPAPSLSGWDALADVRREIKAHCVGRGSLAERGT